MPDETKVTVARCECPDPDHDCPNVATEDGSPALCTPCLYGCMP